MKTIKIFLASSEELDYDRMAFGNLVRRLDDMYEKRGIRIKLFEWEDYDSAYNDKRKQDEYNDYVRQSDIFLALFHKKAGQFTVEEFDIASKEFKEKASPKVYTYCKDLKPDEEETPELKEFKERLFKEMGHYWCRYDNRESLQFQFVMQLQLVESSQMDDVKVEDGVVTINGLPVAKMENLKFAAANEDYLRMQTDIQELRKEIEKMQLDLEEKQKVLNTIEETPNNENLYKYIKNDVEKLIDNLQPKLNKYNKLKEDFAKHQELLFNTAKRVAKLQGEEINDRIRRAMDALNEGLVREANTILNEAEVDAKNLLNEYKQSKKITEQKRQNLVISIKELSLKASSIMADASILIDERIKQAEEIYKLANSIAEEINYDKEKYIDFLWEYSSFLQVYARYDISIEIHKMLIKMCEEFYGEEHPQTAGTYLNIGNLYYYCGEYNKALKYYELALDIRKKVLGKEHPDTAKSYNNIGNVYSDFGNYDKALEYYQKALDILQNVLGWGKEDYNTATSYNNIGNIYFHRGFYDKALEYYKLSLDIKENVLGKEHPDTARSYFNIGLAYSRRGNYDKALKYYQKALVILEIVLGKEHPDTARSYNNIGTVYINQGNFDKALEYCKLALNIREIVLGKEHPDTADSYHCIGRVYFLLGNYDKALKYYQMSLDIREKVLVKEHPDTADSYHSIGIAYYKQNEYNKALEYCQKALDIREIVLGNEHPDTVLSYMAIAWALHQIEKYEEALPWAERAVEAYPDNPGIIDTLATIHQDLGRYEEALKQFELCLKLMKEQNASEESLHETEDKIAALKAEISK